ncbi:hypothetical protein Dimus_029357, partial [Dionaea muscipula]
MLRDYLIALYKLEVTDDEAQAVATEEAMDEVPPPKKKRVLTNYGVAASKAKEHAVDATKAIVPVAVSEGKARVEKEVQDKGKGGDGASGKR